MARTIRQTVEFEGASPAELFDTYVDAEKHAGIVGSSVIVSRDVGATFQAFGENGLRGRNLLVELDRRIVQAWRGRPWRETDPDSILVLTFTQTPRGARISLVQSDVPDDAYDIIKDGWQKYYWEPWKKLTARARANE